MQTHDESMGGREKYEADKFDRDTLLKYKEDPQLIIEPIHWEKFNVVKLIPHPYAFLIQSLRDLHGKKILEIGCGTGILSVILAKRGAQLVEAFDISQESIEVARRRAEVNNVSNATNFQALSVYDMDYRDDYYDYIVGMNILHHVEIDRIVNKLYSCLKPGGTALFLEPFGNVEWMERFRLIVPVKIDDVDGVSHWQEKLNYSKLERFKSKFRKVELKEFHILSRLDRVMRSKRTIETLGKIDEWLLKNITFLRKYARTIVIKLHK
jgi:ubiquinone/menaquinone biosynthesis C-methylase UbiE